MDKIYYLSVKLLAERLIRDSIEHYWKFVIDAPPSRFSAWI